MARQLFPLGLFPVRARLDGFEVGSFDDRLNLVAGLTYAERRQVVRGITQAGSLASPSSAAWREAFWTWAGLEALDAFQKTRRIPWVSAQPGRKTLLAKLPSDLLPRGLPLDQIGKEVGRIRQRLAEQLFDGGLFVTVSTLHQHIAENLDLRGLSAVQATSLLRERKAIPLRRPGGQFSHNTLKRIISYYGLGSPRTTGLERGYGLHLGRVNQIAQAFAKPTGLDLRSVPWITYRTAKVESSQAT